MKKCFIFLLLSLLLVPLQAVFADEVNESNEATSYVSGYDFNNDRVTKGNGTATTTFIGRYYTVASATTTRYIFDNNGILLATVEGNGTATSTEFSHADHLNSTTITTDEDGNVISAKDYYPFGSERITTGEPVARTYIGEYGDTETSLSYLNARYYQNSRGQFLSQDPVFWESPGSQNLQNPQSLNSYSYAQNDPINSSDPTGESPLDTISNFAGAAADTIASAVNAVLHPISTVKNIVSAVSNPTQTINNIVSSAKSYAETFKAANQDQRDAMIGQLGGSLGLPVIGMTGKVGTVANVAKGTVSSGRSGGFVGRSGFELRNPQGVTRNTPSVINGTNFSGHAIDSIQNRGIMPSVVGNTIRVGETYPTRSGTAGFYDPVNNVRVITDTFGKVITTMWGAPK